MQNNTITTDTHTHGESPNAIIELAPDDIQPNNWAFLRDWANNLGVTIEELLKRILIAAVEGSHYAEKIPEI